MFGCFSFRSGSDADLQALRKDQRTRTGEQFVHPAVQITPLKFFSFARRQYFCRPVEKPKRSLLAEVAHLVEHDLAKVGVAGSSPVFRSTILLPTAEDFFCPPPACCR